MSSHSRGATWSQWEIDTMLRMSLDRAYDDEIVEVVGRSIASIQKKRSELRAAGVEIPRGRARNRGGRKRTVWLELEVGKMNQIVEDGGTLADVADALGRSKEAVRSARRKLRRRGVELARPLSAGGRPLGRCASNDLGPSVPLLEAGRVGRIARVKRETPKPVFLGPHPDERKISHSEQERLRQWDREREAWALAAIERIAQNRREREAAEAKAKGKR